MKNLFLILMVAILALSLACSQQPSSPDNDGQGELTQVEMPVNWQDLFTLYAIPEDGSHDVDLVDPNLQPPQLSDTSYDIYAVTLIWGSLPHSVTDTAHAIDWSGTLGVNGEAIVYPVKTIDFEHGQDSLVPNDIRSQAEWVSLTQGDLDGISFLVFLKRGVIYITAPWLAIETEPFSHRWDFSHLERLSAYYKVGDNAGLGIVAHRVSHNTCPKGSLVGHWNRYDAHPGQGHFEGTWFDDREQPIGYYSGKFWRNDDGMGQFAGSVSGYVTDQVIAEFHGVWHHDDLALCPTCGERHGLFKGRVKWLEHDRIGEMWGVFGDSDIAWDANQRPMKGRWHMQCRNTDRLHPDLD